VIFFFFITLVVAHFALPIAIGIWTARWAHNGFLNRMLGLLGGFLLVILGLYLSGLLADFLHWEVYWPSTHVFSSDGPNWDKSPFMRALDSNFLAYLSYYGARSIGLEIYET